MLQTLVVVVDRDRKHALGFFLTNDIVVEMCIKLLRRRDVRRQNVGNARRRALFMKSFRLPRIRTKALIEPLDAAVADQNAAACIKQSLYIVFMSSANRAAAIDRIIGLSHGSNKISNSCR